MSKLRGADGELLQTRQARVQRWESYFQELLNVHSQVSPEILSQISDLPTCDDLGTTPSFPEFLAAANQLKPGKAN